MNGLIQVISCYANNVTKNTAYTRLLQLALSALLLMIMSIRIYGQTAQAGWDMSTQPGGLNNFGISPLAASTTGTNVTVGQLIRGSGVSTTGTGAARGWGGVNWSLTTSAAGISANQFVSFTIKPKDGYTFSLSSINPFGYRRSNTGPKSGIVQYQINASSFTDIVTLSFSSTSSSGAQIGAINLSAITALQNLPASSTVTFRIVPYGATGTSGTWYIFDFGNSTANDFTVNGTTIIVSGTYSAVGSNVGSPGINWVGKASSYLRPINCQVGDFRVMNYRKVSTTSNNTTDGRGQWFTTMNAQASGANDVSNINMTGGNNNGFNFITGGACGTTAVSGNKWNFATIGSATINTINTITQYGNGGTDMGLNMSTAGYYSFVLKDVASASSGFYVGYTSSKPVTMTHIVASDQRINNITGITTIDATLSALKSPEENIYVRYKTGSNDFSSGSSTISEAATIFGNNLARMTIPRQASGETVYYYVFSSTMSQASLAALSEGDKSCAVLNYTDNSGTNYSYTAPTFYTITATAGSNGAVTPSGVSYVALGILQAYTITPNPGYITSNMLIDNVSIGVQSSYTFYNVTANHTISATFAPLTLDFVNLQTPELATITTGDSVTIFAQAYKSGVTEAAGAGAGISAWIGYSTINSDPSTASFTWVPATFNTQSGDNDEYKVTIGSKLNAGTYYYASRFRINGGAYYYGGYNATGGGQWDGTTNISGTLTINCNTQATPNPTNSGPICENNPLTLFTTAVAGASYSWTGPNGFTSISQIIDFENATTAESGTYSVTTTVAGCTSLPGTTEVVVTAKTTVHIYATACDEYYWALGNRVFYTSGDYFSTDNCKTTILHLTINYSTSNTTTVNACGSYTWSAPLGNGTTYTSSGTYTSTSINSQGCTHTETLQLTITNTGTKPAKPDPISGQRFNLCGGGNFTYTIPQVANATSYNWILPAGITMVSDNGTSATINIPSSFSNKATIKVSASNACTTGGKRAASLYPIADKPDTIYGPLTVTAGTIETYRIDKLQTGLSYNWEIPVGSTIVNGAGTSKIDIQWGSTSGYIRASYSNACGETIKQKIYVTVNSAVAVQRDNTKLPATVTFIKVYPNPTHEVARLIFNTGKTGERFEIQVTDMHGKMILEKEGTSLAGDNMLTINLASFANGMYLVTLVTDKDSRTLKLYKEK